MLFPTFTFAVFFLIVMPLSWATMHRPARWRMFIIAASYVFYSWWDPRYVLLLGGSTLVNQMVAHAIYRAPRIRARRLLLVVGIAFNVAILAYFKYWDFFVTSTQHSLGALGLHLNPPLVSTLIPVGISFYTFMALSYVIDVYRGDFEPVGLSRFAAYLSFFPHLVAGPIVRPAELIPQFDRPRDPRRVDSSRAFGLILGGLFLKVVLATTCSPLVDQVFGSPSLHSAPETLVAIYAYAVQIFSDFAGYTMIAIGVALLLGFELPVNFDNPYRALSLQDFWRRWHMTLSRWLRDYVYIPLGGNRRGELFTYRNLILTMLIGGLWHGAAWTFVFWGGMHGVGLAYERLRAARRERLGMPAPDDTPRRRLLQRVGTFHFVCLGWVFFRASNFGNAWAVLGRLFAGWGSPSPGITFGIVAAVAAGIALQYVPFRAWTGGMAVLSRAPLVAQGAVLALVLMAIDAMGPRGVAPFIYFKF
jgi:D-alanyl-lipoteichoic acid acyltransferase DltB (MBOAT superfamily)